MIQFGNTCYCNSVIQALYFCRPFREKILQYKQQLKKSAYRSMRLLHCHCFFSRYSWEALGSQKENLATCLADLFHNIATQKQLFDNYMQQDAHEFLNYLLNTVSETLIEEKNAERDRLLRNGTLRKGTLNTDRGRDETSGPSSKVDKTWIHEIFQGTLTNETRCLCCETVSSKDEDFLDLSVDIDQNASITHCLRVFSETETCVGTSVGSICFAYLFGYVVLNTFAKLVHQSRKLKKECVSNDYHMLALHLKRFKYMDQLSRYTKLSHRVLFPLELRLFNVSDDASNGDRLYDLVAAVVHCGATPNRGHYITIVKSNSFWLLFDDDIVDKMDISSMEDFFGLSDGGLQKNSESAYILFYQARDCPDLLKSNGSAFSNHASI
ncbi:ubiquitinyl hydrolase 1 [Ostertagia ostertagi]